MTQVAFRCENCYVRVICQENCNIGVKICKRVKWVEGLTFLGESASGHQILMDGNSGDKAPSPMEMVLMAAGGCSAIDVVSILQKVVMM
jgi:hypothetical protein